MPNRRGRGASSSSNSNTWKEKSVPESSPETVAALEDKLSGLNIAGNSPTSRLTTTWKEKSGSIPAPESVAAVENKVSGMNIAGSSLQFGSIPVGNQIPVRTQQKEIWKPKSYGTVSGDGVASKVNGAAESGGVVVQKSNAELAKLFQNPIGSDFNVDNSTFVQSRIRATFYPKFENEKSDQEVSLKHSGSLFMYAGHEGGAYAKNSFGNIYTAVGVFVLGRMFRVAWGTEAFKKQAEFNKYLEENHMCISMELVTAVLGDHGQRPREDYVAVTAVTELGNGKPKFYSTPEIVAFCRKWRLPTNHIWLFSTRKSVSSFFAAYDALCEEGIATTVCKALDEVADISVPGSIDHIKVQGEVLEGLVARIVSHESSKHMEKILKEFPIPPSEGVNQDTGPSLREICAANRSDEKQQIRALLESVGTSFCPNHYDWFGVGSGDAPLKNADKSVVSKFLQAHPADYSTTKLQEIIRLMKQKRLPAAFKCYYNFHKISSIAVDNLNLKMVIHVHSDSAFKRYQKEMRHNPGLWPLYRGFFVDINLFKTNKERAAELAKDSDVLMNQVNAKGSTSTSGTEGLADEDANLMIKLKFLTYKLRTFLIRNGLSVLFKEGPAAYKSYYLRATYIRRKCGNKPLSSSIYLTEVEPFLEQYAKRSPENQFLIGSAGDFVRAEDFLAIIEGGRDEEGDLETQRETPSSPTPTVTDRVSKDEGMIVFFPGIPGCAKSALCKEIQNIPGGLGDDRPIHSLMGDLIKARYWPKLAEERRKKPYTITLADKNAPNEEVWRQVIFSLAPIYSCIVKYTFIFLFLQIEDMCRSTRASAVAVIPDSEGTPSNPYSLDALAVFIFRVLQRVNHPNRREFESELIERFGNVVKMPVVKPDRSSLPITVKSTLEEGLNLFKLHSTRHARLDSTKGTYVREWASWEKRLREVLYQNAGYLNSIQVPFDIAVKQVVDQLKTAAKGGSGTPSTEKRKFGNIVFAAITLPPTDITALLQTLGQNNPKIEGFLKNKDIHNQLKQAHVTLAHKRSHGVTAVANYGVYLNQDVPVDLTALLFSDKSAALEARLGSVGGEKIISKNEWPHVTIWTANGVPAKEANLLLQQSLEGKAVRIEIDPPLTVTGTLDFY
ncbi:hypothetical protein ACHQM5_021813 [Ranunculus cassubicifolius]